MNLDRQFHIRSLVTVAMSVLLQSTPAAQEPNVENFKRFRARAIERLEGREGSRLNSNLVKVFGVPVDIRILTDAEMVFTGRRLTLTLSLNTTDLFLTDSQKTPSGTVVTVFHTDLTLVLRAVASGASASELQRIAQNDDAENQFRDVLLRWDRELPQMLERIVGIRRAEGLRYRDHGPAKAGHYRDARPKSRPTEVRQRLGAPVEQTMEAARQR